MGEIGVIDTGVLIGFTIKNDQHHETTRDYILDHGPEILYVPPRAKSEYDSADSYIRTKLKRQIQAHRIDVIEEIDSTDLHAGVFQYIRDQVLDEDTQPRAFAFLYRWYTDFIEQDVTLAKSTIVRMLSDMETEVMEDQSKEWGGWRSHIDEWVKGIDPYPDLKSRLLLPPCTDLDILIEAHHIASETNPKEVEFGTANPSDFIKEYKNEPKSRKRDILDETRLSHIEDLSNPLSRHFP